MNVGTTERPASGPLASDLPQPGLEIRISSTQRGLADNRSLHCRMSSWQKRVTFDLHLP